MLWERWPSGSGSAMTCSQSRFRLRSLCYWRRVQSELPSQPGRSRSGMVLCCLLRLMRAGRATRALFDMLVVVTGAGRTQVRKSSELKAALHAIHRERHQPHVRTGPTRHLQRRALVTTPGPSRGGRRNDRGPSKMMRLSTTISFRFCTRKESG